MSDKMLAARYYGKEDIRIEEISLPASPKSGEVTVKVAYNGICGSDLHHYYHGPLTSSATEPHPVTGTTLPCVLGHEFSGVISAVGPDVDSRLKEGTKVCIEPIISCMTCTMCKKGQRQLCHVALGFFGYNNSGGLAPFVNVTQANCHVVPENVPLDVAAMVEPLAVAWHAVKQANLQPGQSVLVIGSGPIGAMVTRVLKARGAKWVAVSEPNPTRRKIAWKCGADAVFDPLATDVVAEVMKATSGEGADISLDCAGTQRTFDASCQATKKRGTICMVALWSHPGQIDLFSLLSKEQHITGSACFEAIDMTETLEALSKGEIEVADLITAKIPLQDLMEKGIHSLKNEEYHVKILVDLQSASTTA